MPFSTVGGKLALVKVRESFSQKFNYLALYQLLDAGWQQKNDAKNLEQLRAAFEMNAARLASQVAAKITASPK